jgi:hypothetical protein
MSVDQLSFSQSLQVAIKVWTDFIATTSTMSTLGINRAGGDRCNEPEITPIRLLIQIS